MTERYPVGVSSNPMLAISKHYEVPYELVVGVAECIRTPFRSWRRFDHETRQTMLTHPPFAGNISRIVASIRAELANCGTLKADTAP